MKKIIAIISMLLALCLMTSCGEKGKLVGGVWRSVDDADDYIIFYDDGSCELSDTSKECNYDLYNNDSYKVIKIDIGGFERVDMRIDKLDDNVLVMSILKGEDIDDVSKQVTFHRE